MKRRKTEGRPKAAPSTTHTQQSTSNAPTAQRKPEHYFLDAAIQMRDGDSNGACVTAYAGICAARGQDGR